MKITWLLLSLIFLVSGCGYKFKPLRPMSRSKADYCETQDAVSLRISRLSAEELADCFNGKKATISMVPLMITIKNESEYAVRLSPRQVSLTLLEYEDVYERLRSSICKPWLIGGAIATGALIYGCTQLNQPDDGAKALGSVAVAETALISGGLASEVSKHGNDKFAIDLGRKLFYQEKLLPGERITKIMFADKEQFKKQFKITATFDVKNKDGKRFKPLVFNVRV
jgi:hypothetical protein